MLGELRAALERAEFTTDRIEAAFGGPVLSTASSETAVHRRRLAGDDSFPTLARLFVLGDTVETSALDAALAPVSLDDVEALGLLVLGREGVRATARLLPHGDYFVASDHVEAAPFVDWVAGIHAPSVTLAKLAVRRPAESTLDVGTGCGIQALLAAKHSARVVATDVNERALAFARFNAALNGIDAIELRHGSLLEPVGGERFDLVVANPPYVISPDATFAYRDSGLPRDTLCRRLVEGVPDVLAEGGFAHILVSWAHPYGDGDEWAEPLREWVRGSGCDAWLLHYRTDDALSHAAGWLGPLAGVPHEGHEAALERWVEYLRREEIEAIGYGAVVLRRRSGGANWVRLEELPIDRLEPATDHTLRVVDAETHLSTLDDERAFLAEGFRLVDAHRLEQELVCRDGRFEVESQTLALTEGLGFKAGLDRSTVMLLPHFGAATPLRDVLSAAARDLEVDEADREGFTAAALGVVRQLYGLGFLVRAGD